MSGWQLFSNATRLTIRNAPQLLRATAVWWLLSLALLVLTSWLTTGRLGTLVTLRPDREGAFPDLTATFTMIAIALNLFTLGVIAPLALDIFRSTSSQQGMLPRVSIQRIAQMIWALIVVGLITLGAMAVVGGLLGVVLPRLPLSAAFLLAPIITVFAAWFTSLVSQRLMYRTLDLEADIRAPMTILGLALSAVLFTILTTVLAGILSFALVSVASEIIICNILGWVLTMLWLATLCLRSVPNG